MASSSGDQKALPEDQHAAGNALDGDVETIRLQLRQELARGGADVGDLELRTVECRCVLQHEELDLTHVRIVQRRHADIDRRNGFAIRLDERNLAADIQLTYGPSSRVGECLSPLAQTLLNPHLEEGIEESIRTFAKENNSIGDKAINRLLHRARICHPSFFHKVRREDLRLRICGKGP